MTPADGDGGRDEPRGERFPRRARIRSGREIRAVFREGRRRRSGPLEVFWRPSPAGRARIGLVVPLHGRTVVERNRVRRRLREVVRREWLPAALEQGRELDVVVRAGAAAYDAGFAELRAALLDGLGVLTCDASSSA